MDIVFIAGTGTEVGKTYVAKGLAVAMRNTGIRVGVYKPVASGCIREQADSSVSDTTLRSEDATELWQAAGCPLNLEAVCPQRFEAAVAPDEAARRVQSTVDPALLVNGADRWRGQCETLIIEGAGGLLSPISAELLNIDLFRRFPNASLYLVAANRLGVIHDCIATCRAALNSNVAVSRLYLSAAGPQPDASAESNARQLRQWMPDLDVREISWGGPVG